MLLQKLKFFSLASSRPLLQCPVTLYPPPILSFWLRHSANLLFSFCSIFSPYFWKLGDLPPACFYLKNTFFEKIKIKQKAEHVQAMFPKQVPLRRIVFLLRSKVRLGLGSCAYECFTCSVLSWCTVLGCTRCTYYCSVCCHVAHCLFYLFSQS